MTITTELWERFGRLDTADVPDDVATVARQCILDWFACAIAGSTEPLAEHPARRAGGRRRPIVGDRHRPPHRRAGGGARERSGGSRPRLRRHPHGDGWPSERARASRPPSPSPRSSIARGAELLAAFVAGVEVESRLGAGIGPSHYAKGWHVTSSIGIFGATAAASRLLGPRRRAVRPGHGLGGVAGERPQGELRHHDEAVPRRSRRRARPAVGPARPARLHRQPRRHRRQPGPGPGGRRRPVASGTARRATATGSLPADAVQVPRRLLPDPRRHRGDRRHRGPARGRRGGHAGREPGHPRRVRHTSAHHRARGEVQPDGHDGVHRPRHRHDRSGLVHRRQRQRRARPGPDRATSR